MTLPTRVDEMFCYGVYTASHAITRAYRRHLDPLGLTYPQYVVLTLLWEQDGQKVTELGTKMGMGTNTLTPLIKRLEGLGHVTRKRGEKDGREIYVALTPQGQALRDKAPAITACMIKDTGLPQAELETLNALTHRLTEGLI